jgi:hypothetical protein
VCGGYCVIQHNNTRTRIANNSDWLKNIDGAADVCMARGGSSEKKKKL